MVEFLFKLSKNIVEFVILYYWKGV